MKKLLFAFVLLMGTMFTSCNQGCKCGNNCDCDSSAVEVVIDSVDSVVTDSVISLDSIVADTLTVDTIA